MKVRPVLFGMLVAAVTPAFDALAAAYPWNSVSVKDWVVSVIADWSPMIVFIVFWILYMGLYGGRRRPWQKEYSPARRSTCPTLATPRAPRRDRLGRHPELLGEIERLRAVLWAQLRSRGRSPKQAAD